MRYDNNPWINLEQCHMKIHVDDVVNPINEIMERMTSLFIITQWKSVTNLTVPFFFKINKLGKDHEEGAHFSNTYNLQRFLHPPSEFHSDIVESASPLLVMFLLLASILIKLE